MVMHSNTDKKLQLAKAVLLIMVIALCVVGREVTLWPLATWPMYSRRMPEYPAPSASAIELRVIANTGIHTLTPADLLPMDRASVAEELIKSAVNEKEQKLRDVNRTSLVNLVQHALPDEEIKTIQVWQLQWEVKPLALPPLDRDHPNQAVLLGSLNASPIARTAKEK